MWLYVCERETGREGGECMKILEKESSFHHHPCIMERLMSLGVGEEYSVHFPTARGHAAGERMPGTFPLEAARPRDL